MPQIPLLLFLNLLSQISLLPALPVLPNPDPAPIQPSLVLPASSSPPAIIPAFPEQSAASAASAACPLDLPDELLRGVSRACSPSSGSRLPSRSRCCPALAAWLYSAYSATALGGARALPAGPPSFDLPLLPDDSESCVAGAEEALRARGLPLPRVNATCGLAYCYCGVRLRRLTCPGSFVASGPEDRRLAKQETSRTLERDCARPGLAGCSRCLRTLNQLKGVEGGNQTARADRMKGQPGERECQLMGLTWLLSKNRTLYLQTATAILRAFMATPDAGGGSGPTTCSLPADSLPLAVGSDQIDGGGSSTAAVSPSLWSPLHLLLPIVLSSLL